MMVTANICMAICQIAYSVSCVLQSDLLHRVSAKEVSWYFYYITECLVGSWKCTCCITCHDSHKW